MYLNFCSFDSKFTAENAEDAEDNSEIYGGEIGHLDSRSQRAQFRVS